MSGVRLLTSDLDHGKESRLIEWVALPIEEFCFMLVAARYSGRSAHDVNERSFDDHQV